MKYANMKNRLKIEKIKQIVKRFYLYNAWRLN